MDLFKKLFGGEVNKKSEDKPLLADEFRKPIWTDGVDTDDDDDLFERNDNRLFGFQMFTNPLELQKHFDKQMIEMLKALEEEGTIEVFDHSVRDEYMKPGFEGEITKELQKHKAMDTDLDGEIYADQLHTLLQRISPELKAMLPSKADRPAEPTRKLTEDEQIMDRLQGLGPQDAVVVPRTKRQAPLKPAPPASGVFGSSFQGPKMFGQSIISQTVRRPDGTYETRKTVRDSEGNTKTTVTRSTQDGRVETITSDDSNMTPQLKFPDANVQPSNSVEKPIVDFDSRYFSYHKGGYTLPKNIW